MRPNGLVGESAGTAHAGVRGVASEDVDAHGDDGGSELDRWRRLGPRRGVCVAGLSSVRLRGIARWMGVGPRVNLSLIRSRDSHVIENTILSLRRPDTAS